MSRHKAKKGYRKVWPLDKQQRNQISRDTRNTQAAQSMAQRAADAEIERVQRDVLAILDTITRLGMPDYTISYGATVIASSPPALTPLTPQEMDTMRLFLFQPARVIPPPDPIRIEFGPSSLKDTSPYDMETFRRRVLGVRNEADNNWRLPIIPTDQSVEVVARNPNVVNGTVIAFDQPDSNGTVIAKDAIIGFAPALKSVDFTSLARSINPDWIYTPKPGIDLPEDSYASLSAKLKQAADAIRQDGFVARVMQDEQDRISTRIARKIDQAMADELRAGQDDQA